MESTRPEKVVPGITFYADRGDEYPDGHHHSGNILPIRRAMVFNREIQRGNGNL